MAILVVLILVVLWIAVLTPVGVRRFRERQGHTSIESFHEQLHLLERTGPKLVAPANRLETALSHTGLAPGASGYPAVSSRPERALSLVPDGAAPLHHGTADPDHLTGWAAPLARADRRRRARRRRRDIVLTLALVAVCSGAIGAVHGLHVAWVATALAVLGLCGCVALAAYAQLLEADRRAVRPITPMPVPSPADGPWGQAAARAGYPGAWDENLDAPARPRRAAAGG